MDRQRDLESRLSSERQGRLNLSDRLDEITKVSPGSCMVHCQFVHELLADERPQSAKRHEKDATTLRDRLSEVEPLLTETQQERFQIQKQSEQQRQERSELLLRVFKDVNKFLGTEVSPLYCSHSLFTDGPLVVIFSLLANTAHASRITRLLPTLESLGILSSPGFDR